VSLDFSKSDPRALYLRPAGTTTCPTCHLRWHDFGTKPSDPKGVIGTSFLVARFPILGRIGANWALPLDCTNHHCLAIKVFFYFWYILTFFYFWYILIFYYFWYTCEFKETSPPVLQYLPLVWCY